MISLSISLLWVLVGAVVLGIVIFLGMMLIESFTPLDGRIKKAVWIIYTILVLIYVLTSLSGHPVVLGG